jgi:NADPH:quinone reductase
VLGASGAVGTVAVQAAKALGAGRVVAAARDPEALERLRGLGADAVVQIGGPDDLAAAFEEAAGGPIELTLDPLWGEPAAAALQASAHGARLVNIGQSAGAETTIASATVRGKELQILGHTNTALSPEDKASAYRSLVEQAAAGRVGLEVETFGWDEVTGAWRRQVAFPHRKLVFAPSG